MSTKRRRGALRKVAAALAVLAVALVAGFGVAPRVARAEEAIEPAHTKTLTPNEDGTYTVSLDVTGSVSTTSEDRSPIDVVLVLDTSGSMGNGKDSLMASAKSAINTLASTLLANNDDGAIQMSIVTFANTAEQRNLAGRREEARYWTTTASDISNELDEIGSNGGTNWEAGLAEANSASSGRQGAEKYIIFLSDGDPTFRNSSVITTPGHEEQREIYDRQWVEGKWYGPIYIPGHYENVPTGEYETVWVDEELDEDDGRNTPSGIHGSGNGDEYGANYNCAVAEANNRGSATLYTVELTETSKMQQFATDTNSTYLNGRSPSELKSAFEKIAQEIKRTYSFGNVKINDALSQWAEFAVAGGDSASTPTFTYEKGKDGQLSEWSDAPEAVFDSDSGLITWDLSSIGELEADTTYRVSFVIRPNQLAFDTMASSGVPEGETDSDTGATGFFSNDNDRATLTYSRVTQENEGAPEYGKPETAYYEHRVMSVPTSTLTISKQWKGDGDKPGSIQVAVKQDNKDFTTVTLNEENGWTATVPVAAGPTGHTYEISEQGTIDGWTLDGITLGSGEETDEVKLTGLTAQSATFTVTNVPETYALWVYKTDTDSTVLHNAKFDLYKAADDGSFDRDDDLIIKSDAIGTEDTDDHAVFEDLQPGTYYLVETYVPAGYQLREDPYKIVVTPEGIQFASSVDGETSPATEVDGKDRTYKVSFVNEKAVTEIPSTGGIGDVPLYAAGVVAVAGSVMAARKIKSN